MGRILRVLAVLVILAALALCLFGGYLAIAAGLITIPGLSDMLRSAPQPVAVDPAAVRNVEQKIDDATRADAFTLELSEAELNLLVAKYASGPEAPVQNLRLRLGEGWLGFSGEVPGAVPVPFSGSADVSLVDGQAKLALRDVMVGPFPLPGAAQDLVGPLVDQVGNVNRFLGEGTSAVVLERLQVAPGRLLVRGERRSLPAASVDLGSGRTPGQVPRLTREVPEGRAAAASGPRAVVAVGDSLAAGTGATRPELGFVPRLHRYLETKLGTSLGLQNFAVPGETTGTLVSGGQLGRATAALRQMTGANQPTVVIVSIGANDVNRVLLSGDCQRDATSAVCRAAIDAGLARAEENVPAVLNRLRAAAGPNTPMLVLAYYNPFNLGTGLPFERLSNETVGRLNQAIEGAAAAENARVIDGFKTIGDAAGALTLILRGDIHPTDQGYAFLAAAFMDGFDALPPR